LSKKAPPFHQIFLRKSFRNHSIDPGSQIDFEFGGKLSEHFFVPMRLSKVRKKHSAEIQSMQPDNFNAVLFLQLWRCNF
jgi:hypothetical protein